jgi:two-component system cell cycle response regulator
MQVIVAHRSVSSRRAIRAALARAGIDAAEASGDAAAIVAAIRSGRFDVALVDDPDLVDQLTSEPDVLGTAVVLVGAARQVTSALDALDRGAVDVLAEPPEPGDVVARVTAAARLAGLRTQLLARDETLEGLAYNDELTGLWNRRFLARRLSALVRSAERHGRALSLVLMDIDHFKAINDGHGHAAGDAVLVEIARRLREVIREEDVAGRWGGDELLVMLPDEAAEGARIAAERMRAAIAGAPITAAGEQIAATVSAGYETRAPGEGLDALVRRADEALYAAKQAGRNVVVGPT